VLARRCGAAPPGEVAVVIAVTSPSWAASIAAVTFAVTCLKAQQPHADAC
jgi:molybdopterin synthase catalytic subunit